MESTSISDVRRMCQRGAFRAYVQGGKVFLEDTATGQVVPLNGENSPANTERRAAPHREDRRGSRVERMFGARDTWKSADPDADQGPYLLFCVLGNGDGPLYNWPGVALCRWGLPCGLMPGGGAHCAGRAGPVFVVISCP